MNEAMIAIPIISSSLDYPTPNDWSIVIFMAGCDFQCVDCSNVDLQIPSESENIIKMSVDSLVSLIKEKCQKNFTNKVVLLGGDPLSSYNIEFTRSLLAEISHNYDVCIYTGNSVDVVIMNNIAGFKFLKCGTYQKDQAQTSYKSDESFQLASANQILYDGNLNILSNKGLYNYTGDNIS